MVGIENGEQTRSTLDPSTIALRGQTATLLILFIAVLFAYYQKSKNHAAAPRANVTVPLQSPQLPVVEPLVPSSTISAIIREATDAMHHILPSPPMAQRVWRCLMYRSLTCPLYLRSTSSSTFHTFLHRSRLYIISSLRKSAWCPS